MKPLLLIAAISTIFGLADACIAGPPFVTDDPEPVELRHWELYLGAHLEHDRSGYSGTCPHIEANYGALPNLQLHVIAPLEYVAPSDARAQYGYGETELGLKYRFINQAPGLPSVGFFPIAEMPTGSSDKGLGSGNVQLFLPVWIQRDWKRWTSYGGGGYFIDTKDGNANYWLAGWELQRELSDHLMVGGEVFVTDPSEAGVGTDVSFNVGGQFNINNGNHLLFSSGRSIKGQVSYIGYIAYQWTFGPN